MITLLVDRGKPTSAYYYPSYGQAEAHLYLWGMQVHRYYVISTSCGQHVCY